MSLNGEDRSDHEQECDCSNDDGLVSEEGTAFEHRLNRSLSKLMRKELWSVQQDIKALRSDKEKNMKTINDLATIKEENIALKRECE